MNQCMNSSLRWSRNWAIISKTFVCLNKPNNADFLKELSQELKRACGTGGAVAENTVELQGDLRDRVRDHLTKKGWQVKG